MAISFPKIIETMLQKTKISFSRVYEFLDKAGPSDSGLVGFIVLIVGVLSFFFVLVLTTFLTFHFGIYLVTMFCCLPLYFLKLNLKEKFVVAELVYIFGLKVHLQKGVGANPPFRKFLVFQLLIWVFFCSPCFLKKMEERVVRGLEHVANTRNKPIYL